MALGFSFMIEGIRMMSASPWVAGLLLALTLVLLGCPRVPEMLVLLAIGVAMALIDEPDLMREVGALQPEFRIPALAWGLCPRAASEPDSSCWRCRSFR